MAYTITRREDEVATTRRETGFGVGASLVEALGGAAAIVLSILGLLHISTVLMASIATIVVGAAFLIAGGTWRARVSTAKDEPLANQMIGEGMATESLAGAAGIVLGILSLLGAGATTLLPVSAIVFGGGLLVASRAASRFNGATRGRAELFDFAAEPGALIALAGIVLGILGVAGLSPVVLSLAAMLSFGFAELLSGTSLAGITLRVLNA
jgi:hypothetical protein